MIELLDERIVQQERRLNELASNLEGRTRELHATIERLITAEAAAAELRAKFITLETWAQDSERPPAQTGTRLLELEVLVKRLTTRQKGDPGPPGKQGPVGPPGRPGETGKDGGTVVIREAQQAR